MGDKAEISRMLRLFARLPAAVPRTFRAVSAPLSTGKGFGKKERAEETNYFNEYDRQALEKLKKKRDEATGVAEDDMAPVVAEAPISAAAFETDFVTVDELIELRSELMDKIRSLEDQIG